MSPYVPIFGVDPGPTTGICWLTEPEPSRAILLQCDAPSALPILSLLIGEAPGDRVVIFVEQWAMGATKGGIAGRVTRNLIGAISACDVGRRVRVRAFTASEAKTWATDERIRASGLYERTSGLPHARDAARHALFGGHKLLDAPDPLSTRVRSV